MSKREEFYFRVQRAFEFLGNPIRQKIFLRLIAEGCDCDIDNQTGYSGNCVKGIMDELQLPQSTVSSYLKDLIDGEVIECKKNGKYLYCRPKKETLIAMKSFVDASLAKLTS